LGGRSLLGQVAIAIELAVALTVIGTALFGSQALSERAFRLLRWIATSPSPAAPRPRRREHLILHAAATGSCRRQAKGPAGRAHLDLAGGSRLVADRSGRRLAA
jgi:hypothetical protein